MMKQYAKTPTSFLNPTQHLSEKSFSPLSVRTILLPLAHFLRMEHAARGIHRFRDQ